MTIKLSQADVLSLLADASAENRAATARKIGKQFHEAGVGATERKLMEDIFRVMVKDAEVQVRQALSNSLKDSPDLPREIALTLASDVADVALPVIEFSDVLSEADLLDIIAAKGAEHQKAVARRDHLSEKLSDALVDTRNAEVVAALVSNDGAVLSEDTMARVLDNFGDNPRISEPMAKRKTLPLTVAERLVSLVSDKIRDHLVTHHAMSADVATDLFLSAREKATLGLLQPGTNLRDMMELVDQLHRNKRLTSTLVFRALCMGDVAFFEAALARLAGIPVANAFKLIHDPGGRGREALFEKCGLPKRMLKVCEAALATAADMQISGSDDRERFRQVMIERVLTQFEDNFDPDNLDYFIARLGRGKAA
ncbi:DUF2336 domain-containing protein [Govanella unica]|uniref:DUF2336 domain-containing protein n=1 Tax=Govanella unica TaxID=2975056 RepID=A0A9X3TXJ6_9PROT|nr:DUF2336 domain-containing protein [Govania unica]MDA5193192.1 DUF2336 domain-containing protein [Govania unica]